VIGRIAALTPPTDRPQRKVQRSRIYSRSVAGSLCAEFTGDPDHDRLKVRAPLSQKILRRASSLIGCFNIASIPHG
jgi:hypothetical protein